MYRKLVALLLLIQLIHHQTIAGQIQDAAEEIDVPPAHRAAPPAPPPLAAGAAAPPPPRGPPPPVGGAPPPSYPLFYPAAWLPFGRYSASTSIPVQIIVT
ncbi:vasodilator-stimulated phosphoprotein [Drosophila ficusphila]|uniref:vasodilator-stimulated phosphoprotein n=1 Tax=Drosophila ficusphila TaxID=30025 RepID=UPI0007E8A8A6|nr:vasodilator-stimulated phosphoprotein [Drosophila ficusphila]